MDPVAKFRGAEPGVKFHEITRLSIPVKANKLLLCDVLTTKLLLVSGDPVVNDPLFILLTRLKSPVSDSVI